MSASTDAALSAAPTTSEFINLAHLTYSREYGTLPEGVAPFAPDGGSGPLALEVEADGFYGAAFQTSSGQVIIAFEGTYLSALFEEADLAPALGAADPEFALAQIAADLEIYRGQAPAAFDDALHFTETVLASAGKQGIGAEDVFVTGHSLGGAEAEYVSARLGLAGETYGAPGLPAADVPGRDAPLTNYVEYGDPVGNYSATPENHLGGFLYSDQILRYGDPDYIGAWIARAGLEAAGAEFGPGTTPQQNAEGLLLLAGLAEGFHVLTTYARDLHVTLIDPSVPVPPAGPSALAGAPDGSLAAADRGGLAALVPNAEAAAAPWFA